MAGWIVAAVDIPDELLRLLDEDAKSRGLESSARDLVVGLVERAVYENADGPYARDRLTQCKTRARFRRDLNEATWGKGAADRSLYEERFLCIDMDDFRAYLDVHGLRAGDVALTQVASALRSLFGEGDVYRFGGDEFVVVLRGRSPRVPDTVPEATIKHAVVEVSVRRHRRRTHHVNGWIEHHLCAGILAARVEGCFVECRTPAWMETCT